MKTAFIMFLILIALKREVWIQSVQSLKAFMLYNYTSKTFIHLPCFLLNSPCFFPSYSDNSDEEYCIFLYIIR